MKADNLYTKLENKNEQYPKIKLRILDKNSAGEYFGLIDENRKYFSNFNNFDVNKYKSVEEVKSVLENSINKIRWGIYRRGDLIGTINLTQQKNKQVAEIGYLVAEKYSGQGVATSAVLELADLVKDMFIFFIADAHIDNIASQQVLKKTGFKLIEQVGDKYYYKKRLNL